MPAAAQFRAIRVRHQRIGIAHGDEHALHSGGDHRIGARPGAARVRARFQVEIQGRAARAVAGLLEASTSACFSPRRYGCRGRRLRRSRATITAPTHGFGEASATPCAASSSACCMNCFVGSGARLISVEQRIHEVLRIERQQVADLLADADVAHRQAQLLARWPPRRRPSPCRRAWSARCRSRPPTA